LVGPKGNWAEGRPKDKWVLPPPEKWVSASPKGIWANARPKEKRVMPASKKWVSADPKGNFWGL
jgi:hypothetical protein